MRLTVEFFGLLRQLTGVNESQLEFEGSVDLHGVVEELGRRFPRLIDEGVILQDRELSPSFVFSINGRIVAQNLNARVADNDSLLLISAIWGG